MTRSTASPRTSRSKRLGLSAALVATLLGGGAATLATAGPASAQPPLNCEVDVNDPGCHGSKDAGGAGRTFITSADVWSMTSDTLMVGFDVWQWTSYDNFVSAVENYYNAYAPWNAPCRVGPGCSSSLLNAGDYAILVVYGPK